MPKIAAEASIIEVIEKMVGEGKSEKEIIQALKNLGVKEEQAKKLLLLGEADTYALLRNEIKKIVVSDIEKQRGELDKGVIDRISAEAKRLQQNLLQEMASKSSVTKQEFVKEMDTYRDLILSKQNGFEEEVEKELGKLSTVIEKEQTKTGRMSEEFESIRLDVEEARLKGMAIKNKTLRYLMLILGTCFSVVSIGLIFWMTKNVFSIDYLIVTVTAGLISAALFYVASII